MFEVTARDNLTSARCGVLRLPHGEVATPAFMPVGTNATVKAMPHAQLEELGIPLILSNTYHLYLRPGVEVIRAAGGLHAFSSWKGNILTDSGGYQLFSLARLGKISADCVQFRSHIDGSSHDFTPEKVVDLQTAFGSDIAMPLDFCTPPDIPHEKAEEAVSITSQWLRRSFEQARVTESRILLFGIVQGNFFEDLRRRSVEEVLELEPPGVAVGGLSVGEPYPLFLEMLSLTASSLPQRLPHYLMGVGTPEYILDAVQLGIDMFDCVFPTRTARNGQVFTSRGTINLKKEYNRFDEGPIDEDCGCPTCRRYSRSYLRHLFRAGEISGIILATRHNLEFIEGLMDGIRKSIREGDFGRFRTQFLQKYTASDRKLAEGVEPACD